MTVLTSALNTPFTTTAAVFRAQVTGPGSARLQVKADSAAEWANVGTLPLDGSGGVRNHMLVDNVPAADSYRFVVVDGAPVVCAMV